MFSRRSSRRQRVNGNQRHVRAAVPPRDPPRSSGSTYPPVDEYARATGDVLGVDWPDATELLMTFSAWHTIVGVAPPGTAIALRFERDRPAEVVDGATVAADNRWGDALVLMCDGARFALAYGRTVDEAQDRAERGLGFDIGAVAASACSSCAPRPAAPRRKTRASSTNASA